MFKVRKPLIEKKRRDRINSSLSQLKELLAKSTKQNVSYVCLFELWHSVPVNSCGHVGMLSPFYGTFTQN